MSFSKKFISTYKSFYCLKTLVTMLSKCFWVFFIHWFQTIKYIHQYIESNIMYKQFYGVEELWSSLFFEKFEEIV